MKKSEDKCGIGPGDMVTHINKKDYVFLGKKGDIACLGVIDGTFPKYRECPMGCIREKEWEMAEVVTKGMK